MISKARNALAAIFMAITSWFEPNASKDTDTCIRETEALCLSERPDPADRHEEAEFPSPEPQAITRQPFVPHPGMRMPRRRHKAEQYPAALLGVPSQVT